MHDAIDDVLCFVQFEHIEAVERIDEILAEAGIDAVIQGHFDLALSMGHSLNYGGSVANTVPPAVTYAIARVERACSDRKLPVIPVAGTAEEIALAQRRGRRIACCNTNFHLFLQAAGAQLTACRAMIKSIRGDKT